MDHLQMIQELAQELPPYSYASKEFVPGLTQVLYSGPFWDNREIEMALQAFLTGKWLTAGEYVARFQNVFAKRFGVKYAHMVNSGSSANLVMVTALKKYYGWQDGDEVIVSPVGFPTTIAPLVQNNLKPVFVDIEMDTLNFDLTQVKTAIGSRTRAIFVSPVLGNPPDMDALSEMGIPLIGDNCDSLGSKWHNAYLNERYVAWSTSFYPAHHITTGEGGMVCANDSELMKIVKSLSWWGKACYCVGAANLLSCGTCGNRFSKWIEGLDTVIDHKYLFTNIGYNLKPLDLQGAIGLAQMEKIDVIESRRRKNYEEVSRLFVREGIHTVSKHDAADPCWFGVPIICDTKEIKDHLISYLEKNRIQTRQYFAGNILHHPAFKGLGAAVQFPNANKVLDLVFFVGCPPHYNGEVISYFADILDKWRSNGD